MNAPSIHVGRFNRAQLRTVAGCVRRVLADSNRTEDIVTAEEIAAQAQLKHLVEAGVFESSAGRALLRDQPDFANVDLDALRELPARTLGGALARFFDDNGLTTKLYGAPTDYTEDPECAYLMRRIRQSHDLWHVLMNFSVRGHDEILLHAFSLAQTGFPSSVVLMALGSLKHMLFEARFACLTQGMQEAYRRGRDAERLLTVRWEEHWEDSLEDVREHYGVQPWTEADRAACEPWRFRLARGLRAA